MLMVLLLAVTLGIVVVLTHLGATVVDRAHARTAADAAALAGAAQGRPVAEEVARRNGAQIESFVVLDGQTEVTVRVGRARATARAELRVRAQSALVPA